jgi:AraC family transcriptional regulator
VNRVTPVASSALVSISRFDHPAQEAHRDPEGEQAGGFCVSFVESGGFELRVERERHRLDPATLFLTWPGLSFQCRHDSETPTDVCLTVDVAETLARDVAATLGGPLAPPSPVVRLTNRLAYLRLALLASAPGDALGGETLASEVLAAARGPAGPAARLFRPNQIAWYAARVGRAREKLAAEYAEPHTLRGLARDAGMSPFHFARVFRELAGVPPHRYLRGVRLARAAERLREGARVTEACFACGFSNLGHFSRSFRSTFGVSPSRYRR